MSLDESAPVTTDTAPTTTDAPVAGTTVAPASDWTTALSEDTRATVAAKGWKSPEDPIKSYNELFRAFSDTKAKSLVPPGDDAKPEDWDAFYAKLGRPEKPDGYDFKLPEGLPETFPYDAKDAAEFKNWAHEEGLTPKQAQRLHDKFVSRQAGTLQAHSEASAKAIEEAHGTLVKEWGDPSSDKYKRNQELANRAIRQQGGSELLKELQSIGALGPNGEVKAPKLAVMLAKTGEALYAEDTSFGGTGGVGPNPFSPKSLDLTKQGQIIRTDPDLARTLIRNAGDDPKGWGL